MLEVETYWKQKVTHTNQNWSDFHREESDKWLEQTKELINKRDKAWEQKLSGAKSKPKPPSN